MSNLISSFIIEPVIRQARRLSGTALRSRDPPAAIGDPLSHAWPAGQGASNDDDGDAAADAASRTSDGIPIPTSLTTNNVAGLQSPSLREDELPRALVARQRSYGVSGAYAHDLISSHSAHNFSMHTRSVATPSSEHSGGSDEDSVISTGADRSRSSTVDEMPAATRDLCRSSRMSAALPDDDGMQLLRQQIHGIRELEVSGEEKAKRMHALMTEAYRATQEHLVRPRSSLSVQDIDAASLSTAASLDSEDATPTPSTAFPKTSANNYNLGPEDARPVYRPRRQYQNLSGSPGEHSEAKVCEGEGEDEPVLGCEHYKRNVKVQCFECNRWYPCRHCHDELEDHELNRKMTKNMLCMLCGTPQPAQQYCKECGGLAACYYCDICKFWDDDSARNTYHCNDCGMCRRGQGLGKDFTHCKKCNVCINVQFLTTHCCREGATDCDCPICGDYLFTSSTSVASLPCGHYMHKTCYGLYMERAYKCPICSKSAVNMELLWRKLDRDIKAQPMPESFAQTTALVYCNDCSAKSSVAYHWLGKKCLTCDSYNTAEIRVFNHPDRNQLDPDMRPTSPTDYSNHSVTRTVVRPTSSSGSYFLSVQERSQVTSSDADQSIFSPYQMIQRVNRSLSPIRNYLGVRGEDAGPVNLDNNGIVDFWGTDGQFLSGGEDDADDDQEDKEDSEDSMDDDEAVEDEECDEDEESEEEMGSIALRGHI